MNYNKIILILVIAFSCKEVKTAEKLKVDNETELLALPYFNKADFTPEWNSPIHTIPPFSFTNQIGDTITNATYKGKIYVADFFFTSCPGICPRLTKNMASLQETYKNEPDILLLSHSVMPWYDTEEILKEYAIRNDVDDKKWNLVTGDKNELYDITRNGYFADEDFVEAADDDDFIHTENFILVDKEGHIRGVYNGTLEFDLTRLKRHIEILKNES